MQAFLAIAIVLALAPLGNAQSQEPSPSGAVAKRPLAQRDDRVAQQPRVAERRGTPQMPPEVRIPGTFPVPRNPVDTKQEEDRAHEHDANARELVRATWVLAFFTLLLGLVGGGQVVLFFVQLRLIRKSLDDAKMAAEAARDGARAARDSADTAKLSMIASDRAYVHHDGFRWISHRHTETNRIFWRIWPKWINSGNTPTRQLRAYVKYELRETTLPQDFPFSADADSPVVPGIIAPKGIIHSAPFELFGDDLIAIARGERHFYAWGVAMYNDVFPGTPRRVTKWCSFIAGVTGDPLLPYDEKSNPVDLLFAVYPRHNCGDEECDADG